MDNRRVIRAYKDRYKERVLPYPARQGLFSKVKRYLSGGSLWQNQQQRDGQQQDSDPSSRLPSRAASVSIPHQHNSRFLSDSFSVPNRSVTGPDTTTTPNEVLSSFFKEKGDAPLTEIEYEGVVSLLERSKANVTLPGHNDSTALHRNSTILNHNDTADNHTVLPPLYSQKVLRNSSMHDGNSTASLVHSDYRPAYQNYEHSLATNPPMKRVFQFSGVPSPYQTRIKAPGSKPKRIKRIASTEPNASTDSVISASTTAKPISSTANSLLSVLDGHNNTASEDLPQKSQEKPLLNPYARHKRRTATQQLQKPTPPISTAEDISKTVNYNTAKELPVGLGKPAEKKEDLLFGNSKGTTGKVFGLVDSPEDDSKKTSKASTLFSKETQKTEEKPAFSFGAQPKAAFDLSGLASDNQPPKADAEPLFLFGKSTEPSFPSKPKATESADDQIKFGKAETPVFELDNKKPASEENKKEPAPFSFGSAPQKPETKQDEQPKSSLFSFGAAKQSPENAEQEKPKFSFGATNQASEKPEQNKPMFSFGFNNTAALSFGKKNGEDTGSEEKKPEQPKPFTFGAKPSADAESDKKPAFSFGALNQEKKDTDSNSAKKPAFSFGGFGQEKKDSDANEKPAVGISQDSKPLFNFAQSQNPETKNKLFNFAKPSAEQPAADNNTVKPTFGSINASAEKPEEVKKPAFTFGKSSETEKPAEPVSKPAFSFGASANGGNNASNDKPAFSFGQKSEEEPKDKPAFSFEKKPEETKEKPAFSFGQKSEDKPAFSFGKAPEAGSEKPAFSFGSKPNDEKKPAFSFGNSDSKPPVSFGANNSEKKEPSNASEPTKPAFTFAPTKPEQPSKPAFSFGSKPESKETEDSEKKEEQKPLFSFGSKPEGSNDKPAFSFGSKPEGGNDKPAFSFGSGNTENKAKPAFSFGNTEAKPAFSFGQSLSEQPKPAFSFGKPENKEASEDKAEKKPAFSFGAKPEELKPPANFAAQAEQKVPAFSFGKKPDDKPAFNFAGKAEDKPEEKKPAFSFGTLGNNGEKKEESKPFTFGEKKPESQPLGAFSFGSKPTFDFNKKRTSDDSGFEFPEPKKSVLTAEEKAKVAEYEDRFEF